MRLSLTRRLTAVGTIVALAFAAQPTAAVAAAPVVPLGEAGSLTIAGRGYGHGRGMSQFGAAGAARAGLTWRQITSFYYPGAVPTRLTPRTIRVGLADTVGTGLRVVAGPGLTATDGRVTRALPTRDVRNGVAVAITRWEVAVPSGGASGAALRYTTADGRQGSLALSSGSWTIASTTGRLRVTAPAGTAGATYLGRLSGIREGSVITPVLSTSLDDYVRMVVPSEVYAGWPAQALAAQAVAARTYALARSSRSAGSSDICSSTRCQVVGSIALETASTRAAVAATAGVVLTVRGTPITAEFSSSSGGQTVSGGRSYLPAKSDPYDANVYNTGVAWTRQISRATLTAAYPALGTVTGVQVLARDGLGAFGGRVRSVRVIGTKGALTTTGDSLRSALGLRSTLFAVSTSPATAAR